MKYAYLIYVDELENHNKFYEISEGDNGIDVTYGRVGSNGIKKHYDRYATSFERLRESKIEKGYEDRTALHSKVISDEEKYTDYKAIEDGVVDEVISFLYQSSKNFMKNNYTVKPNEITEKMIQEADANITELCRMAEDGATVYSFNEELKTLFSNVPRKMNKVNEFLAKEPNDYAKIIEREREMLDNVKGQFLTADVQDNSKDSNILEAYGLRAVRPTYKEEDKIIANLGYDYDKKNLEQRYISCYKVENQKTQQAYDKFIKENNIGQKDIRHFYHGSKIENWFSIMKQGLLLNPDAKVTGKMFGQGIYFAGEKECRKSLNYMDVKGAVWNNGGRDSGYIAVYSVALGKCYKPRSSLPSGFNYRNLPNGCKSVYADKNLIGLRNDEYIVYRQEQCTIEYMIEMSAYPRAMSFNLERNNIRDEITRGFTSLIKTKQGFKAELDLEKISDKCYDELDKNMDLSNVKKLFFDYNSAKNTLRLSAETFDKDEKSFKPNLTGHDNAFLMREMKKAFANSEYEWENLVKASEKVKVGKAVATICYIEPNKTIER